MPLAAPAPVARFDDVAAGHAVQFSRADRVIEAWRPDEVRPALAAVEEAVAGGAWAFGMLAYEAAAGLDAQTRVRAPREGLPLVWFGLATAPDEAPRAAHHRRGVHARTVEADWDRAQHAGRVEAVRAAIAEGETYQCNLTTRLRSRFTGTLKAGSSPTGSRAPTTPSSTWGGRPWSARAPNPSSAGGGGSCAPCR